MKHIESIAEVLVRRDGITMEDAEHLVALAMEDLSARLSRGENTDDVCEDWFGLEPDYIYELIEHM